MATQIVRLWGDIHIVDGYIAACHEPGFVLRFLTGQRCLLEVALCFHCENVSWQSTPFTTSCRQMAPAEFDKKAAAKALETFLTEVH